jgi:secondary thiamine-phosphate synthase enzyme
MPLLQHLGELTVTTPGRGFSAITEALTRWLTEQHARDGLLTVFLRHTSASLVIHENADPMVLADLERFFARLVPDGDPLFGHDAEGPDDMPAHVRSVLTQTHLSIPVRGGALTLGTWQGVSIWEHRLGAHRRTLALHYAGT